MATIHELRLEKNRARVRAEVALQLEREAAAHMTQNAGVFGVRQDLETWRQARETSKRVLKEFEAAQSAYLEALRNAKNAPEDFLNR